MNKSSYAESNNNNNRNRHCNNYYKNSKQKHSEPNPFQSFKSTSSSNHKYKHHLLNNNNHYQNHSLTIGQFIIGKTLGKGTFGKVKLGTHMITGEKAAIKILDKVKLLDETDKSRISREIKILKSTFHHNIIRIYSVIETQKQIYLLTEYAEGGELFNYIVLKRKLSEYEACKFFHQIIDAIDYLHKLGICHRDLKPENMLLDYKLNLKLADFGLSNLYSKGELLHTACGSPGYAAPEMILGEQYNGLLTDIWSCGIILFVMLCGYLPFDDVNESDLYQKILIGKYTLPHGLSTMAKDLIRRIIVTDPNQRMSISQIRNHPWYNVYDIGRVNGLFLSIQPIPIDSRVVREMKQYGYDEDDMTNMLIGNKHNNATTLYYMLIKKNLKKGIQSISDMISKQFKLYVLQSNNNNADPDYLILTRVNSSINIENNTASTINNSNLSQKSKSKCIYYQDQMEEILTGNNIDRDCNNDNEMLMANNVSESSDNEHKAISNLENIIELSEKIETFGNIQPKITRMKGFKRLKRFKMIQNEIPLMNQLRSQYEKYVTNSLIKKQQPVKFIKGFLQTSMSFQKNDRNNGNSISTGNTNNNMHNTRQTSTYDHNTSTTPSNNNSKSPTSINKNTYFKKNVNNKFNNLMKGHRKRGLSQPRKGYEIDKKRNFDKEKSRQLVHSTIGKSTENSSNRKNSNSISNNNSILNQKKNIRLINFKPKKIVSSIKKYKNIHCRTPGISNSKNKDRSNIHLYTSKNNYNNNNIIDRFQPHQQKNCNININTNNKSHFNIIRSMDYKGVERNNLFFSFRRKSYSNNNEKKARSNNTHHKNINSYQKIFIYKKIPKIIKIDFKRPVSEPKKSIQFNQRKYFPNKPKQVNKAGKRIHSRTIAIPLTKRESKNKSKSKSKGKPYRSCDKGKSHALYPKPKLINCTVNKSIATERYSNNTNNNNRNILKEKVVYNVDKAPFINLRTFKKNNLNHSNFSSTSQNKPSKTHHSQSTCSTPKKKLQLIEIIA